MSKAHQIKRVSKTREENDFYPTPEKAVYELLKRERLEIRRTMDVYKGVRT